MAAEKEESSMAAHTQESEECSPGGAAPAQLSAAQRARIERNRLRARALQDARLVRRPPKWARELGLPTPK